MVGNWYFKSPVQSQLEGVGTTMEMLTSSETPSQYKLLDKSMRDLCAVHPFYWWIEERVITLHIIPRASIVAKR